MFLLKYGRFFCVIILFCVLFIFFEICVSYNIIPEYKSLKMVDRIIQKRYLMAINYHLPLFKGYLNFNYHKPPLKATNGY